MRKGKLWQSPLWQLNEDDTRTMETSRKDAIDGAHTPVSKLKEGSNSNQICLSDPDFISFGCVPRSRAAGSCGSPVFSFLTHIHTVFRIGCASLHWGLL